MLNRKVLNVVSMFVPRVGYEERDKEEFWREVN